MDFQPHPAPSLIKALKRYIDSEKKDLVYGIKKSYPGKGRLCLFFQK